MSLVMHTYLPSFDATLVPAWLDRLEKVGMSCEIHPGIAWESHSGFLPFKLRIADSAHTDLNGVDFLTGFEYYAEPFSLESELASMAPKKSMLQRLLGKPEPSRHYANADVDKDLRRCKRRLSFSWGSADLFELRMATVSSAALAEVAAGVACYAPDDLWYDRSWTPERAAAEARDYENSLKPRDLTTHRFEAWL